MSLSLSKLSWIITWCITIMYVGLAVVEFLFFTFTGQGFLAMEPNPLIAGGEAIMGLFAGARILMFLKKELGMEETLWKALNEPK